MLLDTNILLRMAQPRSPHHQTAIHAVLELHQRGVHLFLVPQILYEFWVVATRPVDVNGLGMDATDVDASITQLIADYQLLRDERGIFSRWQNLVVEHQIQGKSAHYAQLVAAMQRHGLSQLLTFNVGDFARYPSISAIAPGDVMASRDIR